MTGSNESLNSAFTDSSAAADGDDNSLKEIPPDFDVDPASQDDSAAGADEGPSSTIDTAADDDDRDQTLTRACSQTSTAKNDETEASPSKNLSSSAAANDDEDRTSTDDDPPSTEPVAVETADKADDMTEPDNDDERTGIAVVAESDADLAGEAVSSADRASSNFNELAADELTNEEVVDLDEKEGGGLSQREDSGIVNGEVQTTPGSSWDAAVSTSSSDGDVVTVQQADVVVHASADATPTEEGVDRHSVRSDRRRASADSTDRFVSLTGT